MALGHNHLTLTTWRYADPNGFGEYMRLRGPYKRNAHALGVSLISDTAGVVTGYPGLETIQKLPSFADAIASFPIGKKLVPRVDLASTPGIVCLVNGDMTQLEDDDRKLRARRMDQVLELVTRDSECCGLKQR